MSINIQTKNGLKDILKDLLSKYESGSNVIKTIDIPETEWVGTNAPYTQTVSIPEVTAANYINIYPQEGITAEQYRAIMYANIEGCEQAEGSVTLAAYGKKPEIALPLRFMISRDRIYNEIKIFEIDRGQTATISYENPKPIFYSYFLLAFYRYPNKDLNHMVYGFYIVNGIENDESTFQIDIVKDIIVNVYMAVSMKAPFQNNGLFSITTQEESDVIIAMIPICGRIPDLINVN